MLSDTDHAAVLREAVATTASGLGVEYASVLELQPDGATLLLRAGYGWRHGVGEVVSDLESSSPAAHALRTGAPALVEHRPGSRHDRRGELLRAHGVASSAAMVILDDGRPYGVLAAHSVRRHAFGRNDLFFLRSVANVVSAGIALERSVASARRLAGIVESSLDAIVGSTPERIVTSWNAAAERLFGYSAEEMIGRSIAILTPPERRDELHTVTALLERGETVDHFETVRVCKDGTRVDVSLTVSPIVDAAGNVTGASAIARDVGERKRAEARLSRSEARYRDLFENATDLIATVDLDSRLTSVNAAFARALGYARGELVGRPLHELVPPEWHERLRRAYRDKVEAGVHATVYEHELLAKGGHRIQVEVASRLILEEGRPVGTEAICRDVSERKLLEEQLRQAQRLESVGRLAGGVAHDFNNLLTVIGGYADALLDGRDPASEPELRQIAAAAERASILTRQLLAFSRRQLLQPRVIDLNEVVAGITSMLARLLGEHVDLVTALDPDLEPVLADPNQVEQVLVNLAVNGRDAMPEGGTLTIETGNAVLGDHDVAQHLGAAAGPHAMLAVGDTGVGMDAETAALIFEPFFTTKSVGTGTGLGLSTVYGIVRQSSGSIRVESELGRGTTLRVYLPVAATTRPVEREPRDDVASPTGSERILVVEDEAALRGLVARMLAQHGYEVVTAATPHEALHVVEEQVRPIDLLLTDLVMPQMSGGDLARRVRQRLPAARLVFMSGYASEAVASSGALDPDAPLLEKPFSAHDLCQVVRRVLDRPV